MLSGGDLNGFQDIKTLKVQGGKTTCTVLTYIPSDALLYKEQEYIRFREGGINGFQRY
jgi:hypothetical protein